MRGETVIACRLRAATRSLTRASRALTSSFMASTVWLRGALGSRPRAAPMRARMRASHRSVLASLPAALSEASGLTGIDLDPRQAGRVEGVLEETVIGPRRLEHDSGDVEPFELFDQGAMALR